MPSLFIQLVACVRIFYFESVGNIPLCEIYMENIYFILFIHSSVDEYLSCFYLLDIMHRAIMNMYAIYLFESLLLILHIDLYTQK